MNDLEKRKAMAVEEYKKVVDWSIRESQKVIEELDKNGKFIKLDGNHDAYRYIREEEIRRLKEILKKYNLLDLGYD